MRQDRFQYFINQMTSTTYFIDHLNSLPNILGIIILVLCSSALPFLLSQTGHNLLIRLTFFVDGILLEELLHLLLILFWTKSSGIKCRFVTLRKILVSFSWFVPEDVPMRAKQFAVLAPPALVVIVGILLVYYHIHPGHLSAVRAWSYGVLFFGAPAMSLLPFEFGLLRSDAAQFRILRRQSNAVKTHH